MPSSERGESKGAMTFRRVAGFMSLLPVAYLVVVFALSSFHLGRFQLLQVVIGNDNAPGGIGFSLERMREAERWGPVDILFVGSSHAYRGFDPRLFADLGFTSFNLGSKAQSPLNSYFLLKRYWPRLKPKLMVMEVYPAALAVDGLESFYDLTVNSPVSGELAQMALAVKHPHAVNAIVSAYLGRLWRPLDGLRQAEISGETYIAGGYVEAPGRPDVRKISSLQFDLVDRQLEYLRRIIAFAQAQDSRIILVIHPLPPRYLASIRNYWAASGTISSMATQAGVPFWDFNRDLRLDDERHFKDMDHLNASGVREFNRAFIERMKEHGLMSQSR
jgi:hypothetical protein